MIKHEVPVVHMTPLGRLIDDQMNLYNLNDYIESSTIPLYYKNQIGLGIPFKNSDSFNNTPHKDLRFTNIVNDHLRTMIKELKCLH